MHTAGSSRRGNKVSEHGKRKSDAAWTRGNSMKLVVSFGRGTNFADIAKAKELTWEEYVAMLTTNIPETNDKSTRGWSIPASFDDEWRHGENFKHRYALTFDYDKVTPFDVD